MYIKNYLFFLGSLFLIFSCKKKDADITYSQPKTGELVLKIQHLFDNSQLIFDSVLYVNSSNNVISVTKLQYYISEIKLSGTTVTSFDSVYYVDAKKESTDIVLKEIPEGTVSSMSFLIGISASKNNTGSLPNSQENLNMAWPDMMGGGYHFVKMEGYYKKENITSTNAGYTFHIGTSAIQIPLEIPCSFELSKVGKTVELEMNIAEWFKNPHTYNLSSKNASTMSNDSLMKVLAQNATTVFSINQK